MARVATMTMGVEDATKLGGTFAVVVTSLLGYLTWSTTRRDKARETTEQRVAREAAEAGAREDRLESSMWRLINDTRTEQMRLAAQVLTFEGRVASLQETIAGLREENITVRADLAQAQYTITRLSGENEGLRGRVAELERHDGPGGGAAGDREGGRP